MRRRPHLLATLLASGCFTDYAPNTSNDPGASTSSTTDPGTTGTDTSTGEPLADTSSESSESSSSESGSTSSEPATTIVRPETGEPIDPYAACLASTPNFTCNDCLCTQCLEQFTACSADRGCVAIEACAAENGCSGADCLEPCGDVIDMHGGITGDPVQLAIALSDCFNTNCCGP